MAGPEKRWRHGGGPEDHSHVNTSVPAWIERLGITDRDTGLAKAHDSWHLLIEAGQKGMGSSSDYTEAHLIFSGFLARAQGFHEGAVAAIRAGNPYAAFTLLRAYAENVAAIMYVIDHPAELEKFWRDMDGIGVWIGKMTKHATKQSAGFKGIYQQLCGYAHPHARSMLTSSRVAEGRIVEWSSAPAFKSEDDALIASAWVVELAQATAHYLVEFARKFGLIADR